MIICGLVEGHQIMEKEVNKENHRDLILGWLRTDYFPDLKLNFNRASNICFSSVGVGRVNFCSIKQVLSCHMSNNVHPLGRFFSRSKAFI